MKSHFYIVISILFNSIIFTQTATPPSNFGVSGGSSGDPYFIASLDNLYWLSQTSTEWDRFYKQTANIDATTTGTWDSGAGWNPVGNNTTQFIGGYDGDEYTIDGLTINRLSTDDNGLFGEVGGATFDNIGLTNVNIQGLSYVGGLCGAAMSSTINNCYTTGVILTGYLYIGGLVGYNSSSDIVNCYSTVTVNGDQNVGGLVGYNYLNSNIERCFSTGDVKADIYGGGLVGHQSGGTAKIRDCYSTGNVQRTVGSGTPTFGGFCGENNDRVIRRCYSIGSVTYAGTGDPTDAGFVGYNVTGTYANNFWDSEASNQLTATGATAKTTAQMKSHHTFTDYTDGTDGLSLPVWDFATNPNDDVADNDYWDITPMGGPQKVRALSKSMTIDDNYPFLDFQNGGDTALPVELTSFIVENSLQRVHCKWTTESEIENLGFLLERKTEGTDWSEIASYKTDNTLMGQGTTSAPTDYEYIDKLVVANTTYEYRLADVDYDGVVTYHSVRTVTVEQSPLNSKLEEFKVLPAYPNPFNPITKLTYGLDKDSKVSITIYDISGKQVNILLNTEQQQGWYSIEWNGTDNNYNQVPAGMYFGKITSNEQTKTVKLMLLK